MRLRRRKKDHDERVHIHEYLVELAGMVTAFLISQWVYPKIVALNLW